MRVIGSERPKERVLGDSLRLPRLRRAVGAEVGGGSVSEKEPWKGDHGFTGMSLLAWKRQRQAQLDLLSHDHWRTSKDAKERGYYVLLKVARNACICPRTYGGTGTSAGESWVAEFNGWPVKPDLSGANLSVANLSGADLSGANLYGAYRPDLDLPDGWKSDTDGYLSRST